ncbi:MAG: Imm49 family immunity protein [Anaeromyxobacter sp.]
MTRCAAGTGASASAGCSPPASRTTCSPGWPWAGRPSCTGCRGSRRSGSTAAESLPWFDAVAAGADALAAGIARAAAPAWTPGEEYEDDFLYPRVLMSHFGERAPAAQVGALLDRLDALTAGADPRAGLCRGLVERDQARFEEALDQVVARRSEDLDQRRQRGMLPAEEGATEARIWVELLALVRLAQVSGLVVEPDHPLAPSLARRLDRARPPGPDAWRTFPSYRQLG